MDEWRPEGAAPAVAKTMTLPRLAFLAFLPALIALLPIAAELPKAQAAAEPEAAITIQVRLEAGPLAAARIWRFEVVDAAGAVVDTVELSLSGDAADVANQSRALPYGDYTVRQLFGNDMALACAPRVFYANAAPEQAVRLDAPGRTASFTITVCADAPGGVDVERPVDHAPPTPTIVDEVRGTRVAGNLTPVAPGTGTGRTNDSHDGPDTPVIAALAVLMLVAPLAITAIRHE